MQLTGPTHRQACVDEHDAIVDRYVAGDISRGDAAVRLRDIGFSDPKAEMRRIEERENA